MDTTQSDSFPDAAGAPLAGAGPVLHVALRANAPYEPPSRHELAAIETVTFSRGERAALRSGTELAIRIPDPMMSAVHGRMVRMGERWLLEDPSSKNGILLAGARVRSTSLAAGTVFALGHTAFLFDHALHSASADMVASDLAAPLPELATFDESFRGAVDVLARVATADVPVMLHGETGTGKEVLARALHVLSRRSGAFIAVNCGSVAGNLVEAELFGHRKGSFSGATADRVGHIRAADHGTLFLDEVAELPMTAQVSLLRALQQREVVPVGASIPIAVDFRSCAATHRDLAMMVANGAYREDLYARLMGVTIRIPSLRRRRGDLGILIRTLLERGSHGGVRFTPAAALALLAYHWPFNVRELERALGVAIALSGTGPIDVEHLPEPLRNAGTANDAVPLPDGAFSAEDQVLRRQLVQLLDENDHNLAEVARKLGKDRTQIYRWVRRLGISRRS